MVFVIGIDDAGRGPVIGPMVLAGVLIEREHESLLRDWGVKDSKLLNAIKRKEIAEKIHNRFSTHIELTHADEIDSRTFVGTNLNRIEAVKAAQIINNLLRNIGNELESLGEKIKIIIDCPSPNTESWSRYLEKHIEKPDFIELSCEHKADFNHLVCGAASIIAKQTRENEIAKIKEELGIEFGSGYASDPITQKFLEGDLSLLKEKGIIRKSWDTWVKVVAKKEQRKLF